MNAGLRCCVKGTNEEQEAYVDVSEGGSVPVYWQHANRGTQMMETVIGIDLGTSTTEAAVYRNGNVERGKDCLRDYIQYGLQPVS